MKTQAKAFRYGWASVLALFVLAVLPSQAGAITPDELFQKIIPKVQKQPAAKARPAKARTERKKEAAKPEAVEASAPDNPAIAKPRPKPEEAGVVAIEPSGSGTATPIPRDKPAKADGTAVALAALPQGVVPETSSKSSAKSSTKSSTRTSTAAPRIEPVTTVTVTPEGAVKGEKARAAAAAMAGARTRPATQIDELAFAPPSLATPMNWPEPEKATTPVLTPGSTMQDDAAAADQAETEPDDHAVAGDRAREIPLPRSKPNVVLAAIVPPIVPALPTPPAELAACRSQMAALKISAKPMPAVSKGTCGAPDPYDVAALQDGKVALKPDATINCEMTTMLSKWLSEEVQPAASAQFGAPVTGLQVADSYSCRGRNNIVGAQLSEHAFMNAIDISAFQIGGRWVTVEKGDDKPGDSDFIEKVRKSGCDVFMTVLGPGSDGYHENHLHFDMRHRGKHGDSRYCH